jgi:hypothetical protein
MKKYIFACLLILVVISSPVSADDFTNEDRESISNQFSGLSIASQNQGIFQDQNIDILDQNSAEHTIYHPGYKSESTAFLLAVFPGFFVHGLGHFYAEDYTTGIVLLGFGMLIVPGALAEAAYAVADNKDDQGGVNAAHVAFGVGLAAFLASWIYDIAHSSVAVEKYNEKTRAQIYLSSDRENDFKISLAVTF